MRLSEQRSSMLHGVLLMALFSCAAFYVGDMNWVKALSLSPMVVGIVYRVSAFVVSVYCD